MRVVTFTDRFGREHRIGFLPPATELNCREAYGEHWPKLKGYLVNLELLVEKCSPRISACRA